jgi:hypothetical protein
MGKSFPNLCQGFTLPKSHYVYNGLIKAQGFENRFAGYQNYL